MKTHGTKSKQTRQLLSLITAIAIIAQLFNTSFYAASAINSNLLPDYVFVEGYEPHWPDEDNYDCEVENDESNYDCEVGYFEEKEGAQAEPPSFILPVTPLITPLFTGDDLIIQLTWQWIAGENRAVMLVYDEYELRWAISNKQNTVFGSYPIEFIVLQNPIEIWAPVVVAEQIKIWGDAHTIINNAGTGAFVVANGGDLQLWDVFLQRMIPVLPPQGSNNAGITIQSGGQASFGIFDHPNSHIYSFEGGVAVNGGTFVMHGGEIAGNTTTRGGGVAVLDGGTFIMYYGMITDNQAVYGGGVYVSHGGTLEMDGGKIASNMARYGGGIFWNCRHVDWDFSPNEAAIHLCETIHGLDAGCVLWGIFINGLVDIYDNYASAGEILDFFLSDLIGDMINPGLIHDSPNTTIFNNHDIFGLPIRAASPDCPGDCGCDGYGDCGMPNCPCIPYAPCPTPDCPGDCGCDGEADCDLPNCPCVPYTPNPAPDCPGNCGCDGNEGCDLPNCPCVPAGNNGSGDTGDNGEGTGAAAPDDENGNNGDDDNGNDNYENGGEYENGDNEEPYDPYIPYIPDIPYTPDPVTPYYPDEPDVEDDDLGPPWYEGLYVEDLLEMGYRPSDFAGASFNPFHYAPFNGTMTIEELLELGLAPGDFRNNSGNPFLLAPQQSENLQTENPQTGDSHNPSALAIFFAATSLSVFGLILAVRRRKRLPDFL